MAELIVQATGIYKTYDTGKLKVEALKGVSLDVRSGEMVAIMGPSGCGKTTLLNCLSGLDEIDAGQVLIDGVLLHAMPDDERSDYRARNMGFVFQLYNLLPVLSAVENVELPLLVSGVKPAEAHRRSMEMLDLMGLSDRARARIRTASPDDPAQVERLAAQVDTIYVSTLVEDRVARLLPAEKRVLRFDQHLSMESMDLIEAALLFGTPTPAMP